MNLNQGTSYTNQSNNQYENQMGNPNLQRMQDTTNSHNISEFSRPSRQVTMNNTGARESDYKQELN